MKKYRISLAAMMVLCLVSFSLAASDKDKLQGTWKLISIEDPKPNPDAPDINPTGYMIYDSTGHMAFQVTKRPDRPRFASNSLTRGTPEEIKGAFIGYGAYYGTYEVDVKNAIVTHHVEGNLFPNNVGAENIRYYEFVSDNRVTLFVSGRNKDGKILPKNPGGRRLTFERNKLQP